MIEVLTSKDNRILKEIRQLTQKKFRDQLGKFLVEGRTLVSEALNSSAEITMILYCEELISGTNAEKAQEFKEFLERIAGRGIPLYRLDLKLFSELSDTKTPQGILGVAKKKKITQSEFFEGKPEDNFIVLDRLQDPGNLGSILRTADASGFQGIILLKGSGDIYSSKVVRATAGSIFRVPVLFVDTPEETIALLRANGKNILCTSPRAGKAYYDAQIDVNMAIVIGNEANGACDVFMQQCDSQVSIPMAGVVESLNAGICAGILMYETVRQKSK